MRTLLALLVCVSGLFGQQANRYFVSASTTKVTIQQPANGGGNQVQGEQASIYCVAAQTATEEWNGAAATATTTTPKKAIGTFQPALATAWTASNVGGGTSGPVYNVPAGSTMFLDISGVRLGTTGTGTNYSIGTSGTCTITIYWTEGPRGR